MGSEMCIRDRCNTPCLAQSACATGIRRSHPRCRYRRCAVLRKAPCARPPCRPGCPHRCNGTGSRHDGRHPECGGLQAYRRCAAQPMGKIKTGRKDIYENAFTRRVAFRPPKRAEGRSTMGDDIFRKSPKAPLFIFCCLCGSENNRLGRFGCDISKLPMRQS